MPARSKQQQKAAGMAVAAKPGAPSSLKGAAASMYASMTEAQLEEPASTKLKGLPERTK